MANNIGSLNTITPATLIIRNNTTQRTINIRFYGFTINGKANGDINEFLNPSGYIVPSYYPIWLRYRYPVSADYSVQECILSSYEDFIYTDIISIYDGATMIITLTD